MIMSVTRRLRARPSGVSLLSTAGCPRSRSACRRAGLTPLATNRRTTELAAGAGKLPVGGRTACSRSARCPYALDLDLVAVVVSTCATASSAAIESGCKAACPGENSTLALISTAMPRGKLREAYLPALHQRRRAPP
jgi:hypothetical protein